MSRNEMSELTLSGASHGPKPSFKPAVEALEERVVLNVGMPTSSPEPVLSPADFVAIGIIKAQLKLFKKIASKGSEDNLFHNVQLGAHRLTQLSRLRRVLLNKVGIENVNPALVDIFDDLNRGLRVMTLRGVLGKPRRDQERFVHENSGEFIGFLSEHAII